MLRKVPLCEEIFWPYTSKSFISSLSFLVELPSFFLNLQHLNIIIFNCPQMESPWGFPWGSLGLPGMGQDRNFSRQDNSRQRQNLETQDKTNSRQAYCCQDNSRLWCNQKFWFKTSQEFLFLKIHKTRQIKTRFLSRNIKKNSRNC